MLIVENLCRSEDREDVRYDYSYRVVKNKVTFPEIYKVQIESYGIEVERRDTVNGFLVNIERDSVKNISPNKDKVIALVKMLYKHTVSPLHLIDILGEYIDDYTTDYDEMMNNICSC
ncbi:hypothetical protein IRP63_11605 [Clostridium botulinum]|uniref:Uncharacterized protein n=1 Tax=Clostridium botulinum C/D str. DC5 TaxID=1443128 RepID=A0A0A0IHD5_CLOBO|nr:DUF6514 family protein [Clostridium botulinum]KEI06899.1 hypothetical protein Z952_02455 [Clostridium botulinum C/D str. BKT75002]KEI08195.1 hypothetical protein Z954_01620 [Clostridium botulinum C/D str. BKT2873]KGM95765.1 hypothetical protein Z956_04275 [Clostridium botulinum D str. CCUG 7971]KGN00393.1 hypothetical protein Z955_03380 [Clostridium botulinum C/D str. DC5]KOC47987.1 hypothetical protein ADU88_08575 [Clostridium botulinum]